MSRKPIQIAVVPVTLPAVASPLADPGSEVFALCDDGSIWSISGKNGEWVPLPPLPQRPALETFKAEVRNHLLNRYGIRRDLAFQTVEQKDADLNEQYRRNSSSQDVAEEIAKSLGVASKP